MKMTDDANSKDWLSNKSPKKSTAYRTPKHSPKSSVLSLIT